MGAWDELDTEISADVDVNAIDNAILKLMDDEYGIFEPAIEILEDWKTAIDEGSKRGVKEIAGKLRSFQEQALGDLKQHPYSQGILETSIEDEEVDEYTYLVGTTITHFYPLCVEFGRSEIEASPGKALAFYSLSGELVFAKRVRAAEPRPFVAPSYDKTDSVAKTLMLYEINHELQ